MDIITSRGFIVMSDNNLVVRKPTDVQFIGAIHPLKTEIKELVIQPGVSVTDILKIAQPDPTLLQDARVFIDGVEVPPDRWEITYPEKGSVVAARIVPYLRGRGSNPLRMVLMLALIVATAGAAAPLGAAIFGATSALATAVGGAIINVVGGLIINAIAPIRPPSINARAGGTGISPALFIEGGRNRAHAFGAVPSVLGFYRFYPPLAAKTYTESRGDHNIFRMLLVVGLGPLEMSEWRIGNTPLSEFEDKDFNERQGYPSDTKTDLYAQSVDEKNFSIKLTVDGGWHTRVSGVNVNELSIDLAFPGGLILYHDNGSKGIHTLTLEMQYRVVGTEPWLSVPNPTSSFDDERPTDNDDSGLAIDFDGSTIILRYQKPGAMRHYIQWLTPTDGQHEIRMRRISPEDTEGEREAGYKNQTYIDKVYWSTLRTFTAGDPISMPVPVAKMALRIRATDQLSGVLDELNVMVKSIVLDWDSGSGTWQNRVSNNPASLFRHILQGPGKAVPTPTEEIDIEKLQEWHEFCEDNGFTFNMVRDFNTSVYDVLADVAAAGRAGVDLVDGKWSVVVDKPVTITTTFINPRNSTEFEGERLFEEIPHGWRIRFPNEEEGFKQDVRIVYRSGYDETNATLYSQMEFPGVTNADHIWKLGRYYGAVAVQRPERWTVTQDFESLIVRRGMRVKLAHDVMLVGLAYGRVVEVVIKADGNISQIKTDEDLPMVSGTTYGISIRRNVPGDVTVSSLVITLSGSNRIAIPVFPALPEGTVEVGDLFNFGEFGKESEDALVLSVVPQSDFKAQITLIPYRGNEIYGAANGEIPPYIPTVTIDPFLPPVEIVHINSNVEIFNTGVGDTVRVAIQLSARPISINGAYLDVQQRLSGTNGAYYNSESSQINSTAVNIVGMVPGEVLDLRVRWNHESLLPGTWVYIPNSTIVGLNSPPEPLIKMAIKVVGGLAVVTWDSPGLLDLMTRGIARFRHSPNIVDPTWAESTWIGETPARSLTIALPLKDGTYFAKIFDPVTNLNSEVVFLGVVQASVLTFVNLDFINEQPSYFGVHQETVADPKYSILKLSDFTFVDDFGMADDIYLWDAEGGIVSTGIYDFALGFDLGAVRGVRLTTRVLATSVTELDRLDDKLTLFDTWEDFDGVDQAESDIQVWVRYTNDNPASSTTWTAFELLSSSEFLARGFDFEARLTTSSSTVNIYVTELGVDVDIVP